MSGARLADSIQWLEKREQEFSAREGRADMQADRRAGGQAGGQAGGIRREQEQLMDVREKTMAFPEIG